MLLAIAALRLPNWGAGSQVTNTDSLTRLLVALSDFRRPARKSFYWSLWSTNSKTGPQEFFLLNITLRVNTSRTGYQ